MPSALKTYQLSAKEYKTIFDELFPSLCFFANKYMVDLETSKDIVQEVFIKVWEKNTAFKSRESVKSYLYISVRNKALDVLKSVNYRNTHLQKDDIEKLKSESFFLREVVVAEVDKIVRKAVNTLPKKCARIIKLSLNGLTNTEIAQELQISINTIKAQKRIAYQKLRPLLKDYYLLIAFICSQKYY